MDCADADIESPGSSPIGGATHNLRGGWLRFYPHTSLRKTIGPIYACIMNSKSRIHSDIDYDKPGRQMSVLRLVHSDNETPWGFIPVPVAVIAGGSFKRENTVLLSAGNHGNEYEGQVILRRLIHELDPEAMNGRVIIFPALNFPAVMEHSRVSRIDGINMNRTFPGDPDGTPTPAMAHYVESVVLPQCVAAADLHSGGAVSSFMPCAYLRHAGEAALMARKLAACDAFAAPWTVVVSGTADNRSLSAACDRHGVVMVATELAGSASIDLDALEIGYASIRRYLTHFGIMEDSPLAAAPTRYLHTPDASWFVWATSDGIFEPAVRLGDTVHAGQPAGRIHPLNDPFQEPDIVHFRQNGIIAAIHTPAIVHRGQHVFQIAKEIDTTGLT